MKKEIIEIIRAIKRKYEPEGLLILGVFGSFARGEETPESDMDILFAETEASLQKYPGWEFFGLREQAKNDLEKALGRKVDLAERGGLSRTGRKNILPELIYVT